MRSGQGHSTSLTNIYTNAFKINFSLSFGHAIIDSM